LSDCHPEQPAEEIWDDLTYTSYLFHFLWNLYYRYRSKLWKISTLR